MYLACAQVGGLAIVSATGLRSCSSGSLLAPQSRIGSRTAIAVDIPSTVELAGGPVLCAARSTDSTHGASMCMSSASAHSA
jgi:hypothetical protein